MTENYLCCNKVFCAHESVDNYCLSLLIWQLRDGSSHQGTVTSMEPDIDIFVLHSEADKVKIYMH